MPKKILVTGGAGYIGSVLVPQLLNNGFEVTVVDNFMYKQTGLNSLCYFKNFNIINGDVRSESIMKPLFKRADIIIPLAAYVGAPLCYKDPVGASSVNKDAIIMMLKNLSKEQLVIMPTTNSAYGSGEANNFCDENTPLNPISLYAKEKVLIEKVLLEREKSISLRLATVFGMSPRMRLDLLVNDFTYRAFKDNFLVLFESHFKRNYIHVRDISRVFFHCIEQKSIMIGNVYNVGMSEANLSKIELCEAIKINIPNFVFPEEHLGQDPDKRNYIVSNRKIEKTGFKTKISLDDGIKELIKGFEMINNSIFSNI